MRKQFTFYGSFWEAIRWIPRKDRLAILEAIVCYALEGELPEGLKKNQMSFFSLVKPNLDASRKKATAGKKGGSKRKATSKQTESNEQANSKQNESEKESKKENEIEIKNELEIETEYECINIGDFDRFWKAYPRKVGKQKAYEVYRTVGESPERLLAALERQKDSVQWQRDGGRFIPNPATWLAEGRWEDVPQGQERRVLDAEEVAAVRRLMADG